ncbi:MAG: AbrB/MazE/SpoVT family DNA-binding domain-containing protein [Rubrivivax sp.]|nr:MAG: AbrB/MazE/SpoVT family DNA-binding domain-containing protein [Rubrivivax sp.]
MHKVAEPTARYAAAPEPAPERHVRLFRNGANQAVRIPKEFELPGSDALMWREGDRLIIEAVKPQHPKGSPAPLLAALDEMAKLGPIDDEFPDFDAGLLPLDDIDLERD